MKKSGISRQRGKKEAIFRNDRCLLKLEENGESSSDFGGSFAAHTPQVPQSENGSGIPTTTPASDALSKALKKRGFKFVGSTICYSFMQACGLVNDHVTGCFCHPGGADDRPLEP